MYHLVSVKGKKPLFISWSSSCTTVNNSYVHATYWPFSVAWLLLDIYFSVTEAYHRDVTARMKHQAEVHRYFQKYRHERDDMNQVTSWGPTILERPYTSRCLLHRACEL